MLLCWNLVQYSLSGSALNTLFSNSLGGELLENAFVAVCSFLKDMLFAYSFVLGRFGDLSNRSCSGETVRCIR